MPARKNRPVLYEVAGLSRRQRDGKRRLTTPVTPIAAPLEPPPAPPAVEPLDRPPPEERARILRYAAGRLELALGWQALVVAALGAALVLYVTFQAGQRASRGGAPKSTGASAESPSGPPDITTGGTGSTSLAPEHRPVQAVVPPARGAGEPNGATAAPSAPPAPKSTFTVQPGHHYLVIQHFRRSQEKAATDSAEFLRSNGIECVIVRSDDLMLMATRPFLLDQKDAAAAKAEQQACNALKNEILKLGKVYFNELKGGYAFEFCAPRKFGARP